MEFVFLFNSAGKSKFCGGVFTDKAIADKWIEKYKLTGVLTKYPVDVSAYDWAVANGLFSPKKEHEMEPHFIGGFSSAAQEHYHYEDGVCQNY